VLLRENHARIRYALWLAASVKFLIPFSMLVALGAHFGFNKAPVRSQSELLIFVQDFAQPFATSEPAQQALPTTFLLSSARQLLSLLALFLWLAGSLAVLIYWARRLRHLSTTLRRAHPVTTGCEYDALRSLENTIHISHPVDLAFSGNATEPGIFGIFRPTLVLPVGISDRLTETQLESVIVHELCHVSRKDNLTAALHMFVEVLFWFHPLVWWVGARLVDERERACDEEVLRLSSDPQTYAESILKICEFYLESSVVCVSGVTGSNLKKRIEVIMRNRTPSRLNFSRKLLLGSASALAVAIPFAFGVFRPGQIRAQMLDSATFASVHLQPNIMGGPDSPESRSSLFQSAWTETLRA
jgi:bla regulator protein blaR1